MIRQSISCDICGAEKKQTNHWFVTCAHAGELRVSLWSAQAKLRAGSKHLCGQTCLHKLVDEFIAGSMTVRMQPPVPDAASDEPPVARTNPVAVIAIAPSRTVDEPRPPLTALPPADDAPNYASRHWRTEAWERERERERRAGIAPRRKSS
jgi:hypothetical protein